MTRPKHRNRLSIETNKWYAAEQLVELGWGGFCCKDGLATLLVDWAHRGVQGIEADTIPADVLRKTCKPYPHKYSCFTASQTMRFRFKSRKRAKVMRDCLAMADAEDRLSEESTRTSGCICEYDENDR